MNIKIKKQLTSAILALSFVAVVGCEDKSKTMSEVSEATAEATAMVESVVAPEIVAEEAAEVTTPHIIGAAKLIVDDLIKTQEFYEKMFGMKEVKRYDYDLSVFEETIMGFENGGATLALFAPNDKAEMPLKKPAAPVVLLYTPEFEAVSARIKEAGYPVRILVTTETGPFNIAIARDPSGNAVEVFGRKDKEYEVGGSKLMVADRKAAEEFYIEIFNAIPGKRYSSPTYDEVLMEYGTGPFLALYQPLSEEPLPKSMFPQTAIYTTDYDAVLARIEKRGLGYRTVKTQTEGLRIIIARDTAGNAIEIISREK